MTLFSISQSLMIAIYESQLSYKSTKVCRYFTVLFYYDPDGSDARNQAHTVSFFDIVF